MGFEPEIYHVMFHHTNNFYQLKLVQAKGLEPILGSLRDYYSASRIPLAVKLQNSGVNFPMTIRTNNNAFLCFFNCLISAF